MPGEDRSQGRELQEELSEEEKGQCLSSPARPWGELLATGDSSVSL